MKLFTLIVVFLCALCASSSFARIGETEAEIEKRYGSVVVGARDVLGNKGGLYFFNEFSVTVFFIDGESVAEQYKHTGANETELLQSEVEAILAANIPPGATWNSNPTQNEITSSPLLFHSSDGKLAALRSVNVLRIQTERYLQRMVDFSKAEEAKKVKGF